MSTLPPRPPLPHPWPGRRGRRAVALALGGLILAGIAPATMSARALDGDDPFPTAMTASEAVPVPTETRDAAPDGGLLPSISYEDAMAHASDRLDLAPGGRVTVPYRPRTDDAWPIGGARPRALPAGLLTGRAIRDGAATPSPSLADDRPILPSGATMLADTAAWDPASDPLIVRPAAAVDPGALKREVFGFLPYWELADRSTRLDWSRLSTIAYFGVGVDAYGNLVKRYRDGSATPGWAGWTSQRLTNVIGAAHRSQARVVLTVQSFAWSSAGRKQQQRLLGSAKARARLAKQVAQAVRERGADGVNLDFEPIAPGHADEFVSLVRTVRAALDARARGYQLTFDTTGWIGNYPIKEATGRKAADAVVIMGYDYRHADAGRVGSIAPIGGSAYDVRDSLAAYLRRVPASRIILGVPYYGRAWSTDSDKRNARNISSARNGASVAVTYETARAVAAEHGKRYDATEGVAWTAYRRKACITASSCVTTWRQVYFDDARAIKAKYDLVNAYGLRGAAIWALGYDGVRPELSRAIEAAFIRDKVPPVITTAALSSASFSPNGDRSRDTVTASLAAVGLVRWGYRVERTDGPKKKRLLHAGTRSGRAPALNWNGRDRKGRVVKDGRYRITLWAEDVSGNRSSRSQTVLVDRRRPTLRSSAGEGFVSPDKNGANDRLPLAWSASEPLSGTVRILDRKGKTVRSWPFSARTSWSTSWTGRSTSGAVAAAGRYTFRVSGTDAAGNPVTLDRPVLADSTIASVRPKDRSFAPGGRRTDRLAIVLRRPARVSIEVYRGTTLVRRGWTDKARKAGTSTWRWDGRGPGAARLPLGTYRVVVRATSRYGTTHLDTTIRLVDR